MAWLLPILKLFAGLKKSNHEGGSDGNDFVNATSKTEPKEIFLIFSRKVF